MLALYGQLDVIPSLVVMPECEEIKKMHIFIDNESARLYVFCLAANPSNPSSGVGARHPASNCRQRGMKQNCPILEPSQPCFGADQSKAQGNQATRQLNLTAKKQEKNVSSGGNFNLLGVPHGHGCIGCRFGGYRSGREGLKDRRNKFTKINKIKEITNWTVGLDGQNTIREPVTACRFSHEAGAK